MTVDFELSDEQAMLREASRNLLHNKFPRERVRELLDTDHEVDSGLWRLGTGLGWTGLALPPEHDGSGQGLVELAIVAEELGRALARGPFLTTAVVGSAVMRGGSQALQAAVLPRLAGGNRATWAFAEPRAPWTLAGISATAEPDGDGFVLTGTKTAVQDAAGAHWLLVTALLDGRPTSFLLDRNTPGLTIRRQRVLDLTRTFHEVRLDGVRVPRGRRLDGDATDVQRLLDDAAVLGCAESVGVMDRLLEMTVEHTTARVQFGRPIGSFQAVQHAAADSAIDAHGARAATYYAAMAADAGAPDASRAACVAASHVSAVLGAAAGRALQLHGGIGFTWEHDLHLYLRRAKVDEVLHGSAAVHRERLTRLIDATPLPV